MKRIAPGLYDDGDGGLHLAVDELLRAHGFADTPENIERLTRVAQEQIEERYGVPVTITTDPIEGEESN